MKNKLILALSAFLQVGLVACNVVFITRGFIIPMFIVGFGISILWSFNIKKIAFGSIWDRLSYAFGAGLGSVVGWALSHLIL